MFDWLMLKLGYVKFDYVCSAIEQALPNEKVKQIAILYDISGQQAAAHIARIARDKS